MAEANPDLARAAFRGLGMFVATLALLIFVPAWDLMYWQGLLYWLVFAGACLAITLNLMKRDPGLLARRLPAGASAEKVPTQRTIQLAATACFIGTIVLPPVDHLLRWSYVPAWLSIAAAVVVALGFYGVYLTFRENSFASATVQVEDDQRVVTTGPYANVRHPMYATAGLIVLGTPIALGSWWGLIPAVLLMGAIVLRLLDEERYLARNLPGYARYMQTTRYRLVPGIW